MKTYFTWKKDLLSSTYHIYSNDVPVGKLKEKAFSQTANGELKGKEYTFRTRGLLKQHTEITDNIENRVIGFIDYNNWMTKAIISVHGKTINWRSDNIWNTKWSIVDEENNSIKCHCSSTSGRIESDLDDPLLILAGLFVTNYYWQITIAVLVAVFVPIWASVIL